MIKVLLNKARREQQDSFAPFDEESTEYLTEIAGGIPGYVMSYAKAALKMADDKEITTLDKGLTHDCLIEEGLIPEEGIDLISGTVREVEL